MLDVVTSAWSNPWTRWIGGRYLTSKKSSRFLSFITLLSVGGVSLGVAATIVVLSVMEGFEGELLKRLMATDLHVLIQPTSSAQGFDRGHVPSSAIDREAILKDPRVKAIWPIASTEAILRVGKKVSGVVIKGVDSEHLAELGGKVVESAEPQMMTDLDGGQAAQLPGILIGQELAYLLGVIPGDRVTVVSPTEMEGPLASVPRMKQFAVQGIYRSGIPDQEIHTVFTDKMAVYSFLRKANWVNQWELIVKEFDRASEVADDLRVQYPLFRIQDWKNLNANLFGSLRLERIAMFIILAFVVIVASFNIVTTLTLMVLEKKKEIAILKAMGARSSQIGAIFLSEGMFIGLVGVAVGGLFAAAVSFLLRDYEVITLPEVFYDRTLPVAIEPTYYILVGTFAFLVILGACVYPSRRASRCAPLEGIRG